MLIPVLPNTCPRLCYHSAGTLSDRRPVPEGRRAMAPPVA